MSRTDRPPSLPKPRGCVDCGAPGYRAMGGIHRIDHAEDCWRHPANVCPLCDRHHETAEGCVFHGREFDPDAHELVQTAQAALASLFDYRMSQVNRETWLTTLECHLTVLCDDLSDALANGRTEDS